QPAIGVMTGLKKVLGADRRLVESLRNARVVHATTIATNALIESKTARVGLITNRGFRDVLEIRRHYRTNLYDMFMSTPAPLVPRYLSELEDRLRDNGYARELYIMQSNGGMMMSTQIRRTPVNIIESGPAAGVVAAAAIGQLTGRPNLISFDMGGTTAKAAL